MENNKEALWEKLRQNSLAREELEAEYYRRLNEIEFDRYILMRQLERR